MSAATARLLLAATLLALGGCSQLVVSQRYPQASPSAADCDECDRKSGERRNHCLIACVGELTNAERTGLTYFLPKRRVMLKVVREAADLEKLKKKLGEAEARAAETSGTQKAAEKKAAQAAAVAEFASGAAVERAAQESAMAKAEAAASKTAASRAALERDAARAAVLEAESAKSGFVDRISIELLAVEPDPAHAFLADLDHLPTREDDFKIGTTPDGLLSTATLVTTDRTPEIILELAKTARLAAQLVGLFGEAPGPAPTAFPFTYEVVFDPARDEDLLRVNRDLRALATNYRLSVDRDSMPGEGAVEQIDGRVPIEGLVYRRPIPYTIALEEVGARGATHPLRSLQVSLPNDGPIAILPFNAGALVSTTYEVEFKDGMPTLRSLKRPSELWAGIQIVPNVLREIVAIPSDLLQLKIDYSSKEEALLENRKALADTTLELLKSQQALDLFRANPAASDSAGEQ